MKRDIPVVLLVTVVCLVMASDRLLAGALVENIIDRGEGIILLCMLLFYLYFAFLSARREDTLDVAAIQQEDAAVGADVTPKQSITTLLLSLVKLIGGLALLIIGGRLFVSNASEIARSWGVSEAIIGLTIVAIGTSLPELATSVVAAIKRQPDLAMGNIVGSNIFNILFILGSSATITPLVPSGIHFIDYIMMLVAVFLLFIFSNLLGRATISRQEGVILLSIYVAYMIYLVCQVL